MDDALFQVPDGARIEKPDPLSPRTLAERRLALIAHGMHPLTLVKTAGDVWLHPDAPRSADPAEAGPRCGTCVFRYQTPYHDRNFGKCHFPDRPGRYPRMSHSAASDVPMRWPACRDYQPKTDETTQQ